jgi:hypothetical protein
VTVDIPDAICLSTEVQLAAEFTLAFEAVRYQIAAGLTFEVERKDYVGIRNACLAGSIVEAISAVVQRYIAETTFIEGVYSHCIIQAR